jgi:hypothetical protein
MNLVVLAGLLAALVASVPALAQAEDTKEGGDQPKATTAADQVKAEAGDKSSGNAEKAEGDSTESKYPPFDKVIKDAKTYSGLFKLYEKDNTLYAELGSGQFDKDFIVLISIAKGIGQTPLLGGMSWGFGDERAAAPNRRQSISPTRIAFSSACRSPPPRRAAVCSSISRRFS